MAESTSITKRTRTKKVSDEPQVSENIQETTSSSRPSTLKIDLFKELIKSVTQVQEDYEKLQREVTETKESWVKQQQEHERLILERNQGEELIRNREQETYTYNLERQRKQVEDEFSDKKTTWEKQLKDQRETLEKDRLELENLRKLTSSFDEVKEKAVEEAQAILQKELTISFGTEQKLKDQEFKAKEEILDLKISNLVSENIRQKNELEALKKAFEDATTQVKDIAVKVIESGSSNKISTPTETIRT